MWDEEESDEISSSDPSSSGDDSDPQDSAEASDQEEGPKMSPGDPKVLNTEETGGGSDKGATGDVVIEMSEVKRT